MPLAGAIKELTVTTSTKYNTVHLKEQLWRYKHLPPDKHVCAIGDPNSGCVICYEMEKLDEVIKLQELWNLEDWRTL